MTCQGELSAHLTAWAADRAHGLAWPGVCPAPGLQHWQLTELTLWCGQQCTLPCLCTYVTLEGSFNHLQPRSCLCSVWWLGCFIQCQGWTRSLTHTSHTQASTYHRVTCQAEAVSNLTVTVLCVRGHPCAHAAGWGTHVWERFLTLLLQSLNGWSTHGRQPSWWSSFSTNGDVLWSFEPCWCCVDVDSEEHSLR